MSLVRRARYCAPIAEGKDKRAEAGCHPAFYDITFGRSVATAGRLQLPEIAGLPRFRAADYRGDTLPGSAHFFESNLLPRASYACIVRGSPGENYTSIRCRVLVFRSSQRCACCRVQAEDGRRAYTFSDLS